MQFGHLKRREFFALLSGAVAWPLAARAAAGDARDRVSKPHVARSYH
jgi:hypothetical protein